MHFYFELVNTKYFMFKLKLTFFYLLEGKNTDLRRFKLGADREFQPKRQEAGEN
jgi:hypothetical protein